MFQRSVVIMFWMLLGALAAGGGVGYFLWMSNNERAGLNQQIVQANAEAERAARSAQAVADEANQKLVAASTTLEQNQTYIQQLQTILQSFHQANTLPGIDPSAMRFWKTYVSVPLGLSVRLPPGDDVCQEQGATLSCLPRGATSSSQAWLVVQPYDAQQEQLLDQRVQRMQPMNDFIQGRLLIGQRGWTDQQKQTEYVLRLQDAASSTQLLWLRTQSGLTDRQLQGVISTLSFSS